MRCIFSPCRKYRYVLTRLLPVEFSFSERPFTGNTIMFIGLNPSTADETINDPTIRRLIDFSKQWGFTRMLMTNLFAYRATDPNEMKAQGEPVGVKNDKHLLDCAGQSQLIVACWGNHGAHQNRSQHVRQLLAAHRLMHFKLTQANEPIHPLYLPANSLPTPLP